MIKKLLIGSAVYFSVIGATTIANELSKEDKIFINKMEIDNTCRNLLYWLKKDLEESRIDSMVFNSYTWNIKQIKQRNNE
jgi:hypothetical protein